MHADTGLTTENSSDFAFEVRSECQAAIRHLLSRVSTLEAASIPLRDVFEYDYREIAAMLGKSESATRQFLHRASLRWRRAEGYSEVEESELGLYRRAIEAREPTLLMEMLQGTTARALAYPQPLSASRPAREASPCSFRVNRQYAIALVLNGIVLCIVPVGVERMQSTDAA